jgi:hypothetical protein
MSIHRVRKNQAFLYLSALALSLILFAACSDSSTSGIQETEPYAELFPVIDLTDFGALPGDNDLVLCALNPLVLTGNTTDGKPITQYRVTLISEPNASNPPANGLPLEERDSGFMLTDTDYYAPVQNSVEVDAVAGQVTVYLKAALPSSLGTYSIEIIATSDGTFTDYEEPAFLLDLTTYENPCLKTFSDPGADNQGTAAADAPGIPGVDGETVTIQGYNLSINPDIFFLLDDRDGDGIEDAEDARYLLTNIIEIDLTSGFYTLNADIGPGCGVDTDLCVENGNPADPFADYSKVDTAQRKPDLYTYLPIITGVDNLAVTPLVTDDVNPNGSCVGGYDVTIYGGGFLDSYNSTNVAVTIDGNAVDEVKFGSSDCGALVVTVPGFTGADPNNTWVVVNNPDGNSDTWGDDYPAEDGFTYDPNCSSITPSDSGTAGDIRYINGCAFDADVEVTIQTRDDDPGVGYTTLSLHDPGLNPFDPNNLANGEYYRVSASQIAFKVPDGTYDAGQNRTVTITNPSSTSVGNSTTCSFSYLPSCFSLTPDSGQGGVDQVTIIGWGFDTDTNVVIGGNSVSTGISVPNANTITFMTPCDADDYGQGNLVQISDISAVFLSPCAQTFSFEPVCNGPSPTHGQAGAEIVLDGCGYDTDAALTIGATSMNLNDPLTNPGDYYVENGNTIRFLVPDGADDYGQNVTVEVSDAPYTDATCDFDFDPLCSGVNISAGRPGDAAIISGFGFDTDAALTIGATSMNLNDPLTNPGDYYIASGNTINLLLPETTTDPADFGDVSVVITDDSITAYTEDTGCGSIRYYPTCLGIDPSGIAGDTITITGTGFAPEDTLTFGHAAMTRTGTPTNPGDYSIDNANIITVIVPCDYNDITTYDVDVEVIDLDLPGPTPTGESCSTTFVYDPYVDCLTGVDPSEGSPSGNTLVTITGCGFDDDVAIAIGGVALTAPSSCPPPDGETGTYCRNADITINEIVLRTPPGASVETIAISNPTSGGTYSDCDFTYEATCTDVIPEPSDLGYLAYGTKARIIGGGFGQRTEVYFGYGVNVGDTGDDLKLDKGEDGVPADNYPEIPGEWLLYDNGTPGDRSDDEIRVNMPCGGPNDPYDGNLVPIRIVNKNSSSTCEIEFDEHCTGLSNNYDRSCGDTSGDPIVVSGCGFDNTETYTVEFGDAAAAVTAVVVDSNTLNITSVPDGPVAAGDLDGDGTVDISVSPCLDGSCDAVDTFTYDPLCSSLSAATAACGDTVNISGCGFAANADVRFAGVSLNPANVTYNDYGSLDITIPGGPTDVGTVAVDVYNPNTAFCNAGDFTFEPDVGSVTPDTGPMAGGLDVVVAGCGFQGDADVEFGSGNLGTAVSVLDANTINVTTPAAPGLVGPPEPVDVVVTNDPGGPDELSSDPLVDGFTYDVIPIITGLLPDEGPEAGGTSVDISGFQFPAKADLEVTFGALLADITAATVSATQIQYVLTPPGTGTVDVVVTDTSGPAASDPFTGFTYKDRNVSSGYSDASVDGDYNYICIKHDFLVQGDSNDYKFVTSFGDGNVVTFYGDGSYDVAAGADAFEVVDDGTPSTNQITDMAAEIGSSYSVADEGTVTIGNKTGFLSPDANALFVASTLNQAELSNEIYIFTKAGNDATDFLDGKTMGLVAFVHDYGYQDLIDLGTAEAMYSFQGTATFATGNFTLTALTQSKNTQTVGGAAALPVISTGDNSGGTYTFDPTGLFTLSFEAAVASAEADLFDEDVIDGIYTVTDDAATGPQLFAGVNLSSQASSPGRSILLIMVPLGSGKSTSSVGGETDDTGWARGLFGHEFISDVNTYFTSDARITYTPGLPDSIYSETNVDESAIDDSGQSVTSGAGSDYAYEVEANGALTISPATPDPSIEGFVSDDETVTTSVDASESPKNNIRLELTR